MPAATLYFRRAKKSFGTPPTKFSPSPSFQANSIVDSVGVNTHMDYGGVWNDYGSAVARMGDMKIAHVREKVANSTQQNTAWNAFKNAGIKVEAIVCQTTATAAVRDAALGRLNTIHAANGEIDGLEGVNEPNLSGDATWAADARAHQIAIWNAAQSGSSYANLIGKSVVIPGLGKRQDYATLGDLTAYANYGNIHAYPGGGIPERWFSAVLASNATPLNSGTLPVRLTEIGYHNNVQWPSTYGTPSTDTNFGIPYDLAALYAPRVILEAYATGKFQRTFFYDLVDDAGAARGKEQEFGLCYGDVSYNVSEHAVPYSATINYGVGAIVLSSGFYWTASQPTVGHQPPTTSGGTSAYWVAYTAPSQWALKPAGQSLANFMTLLADPGVSFTTATLSLDIPGEPSNMQDLLFQKRDGSWWLAIWREVNVYTPASGGGTYINIAPVTQVVNFDVARNVTTYRPHLSASAQATNTAVTSVSVSIGPEVVLLKIV